MRRAVLALLAVALLACGEDEPSLSGLCLEGERPVARALTAAPNPVRLPDGTSLSSCVSAARTEADLQTFGLIATGVAEDLVRRGDRASSVQLGYLVGATRRGSATTQGVQAELLRRLQVTGRRVPDRLLPVFERGVRAGERTG